MYTRTSTFIMFCRFEYRKRNENHAIELLKNKIKIIIVIIVIAKSNTARHVCNFTTRVSAKVIFLFRFCTTLRSATTPATPIKLSLYNHLTQRIYTHCLQIMKIVVYCLIGMRCKPKRKFPNEILSALIL